MARVYYLLNDTLLTLHNVNSKDDRHIVEFRDAIGNPVVLPNYLVKSLVTQYRAPKDDSVWVDTETGLTMIFHGDKFYHPAKVVSVMEAVKNPERFKPYRTESEEEFFDQLQGIMDDTGGEVRFTWSDGEIEAQLWMENTDVYGHGHRVDSALEEIAVRLFGVENGHDKL